MIRGSIFVSYRRGPDSFIAGRIAGDLKKSYGESNVYLDVDESKRMAGLVFRKIIDDNVDRCEFFLAIVGPGWIQDIDRLSEDDDFVAYEIGAALKNQQLRLIPVIIDNFNIPPDSQLPNTLKGLDSRGGLRIRHDSYANDFDSLVEALGIPSIGKGNVRNTRRIAIGVSILGVLWTCHGLMPPL